MLSNIPDSFFSLSQDLPVSCILADCDNATQTDCLKKIEDSLYKFARMLGYPYLRYSYWLKNAEATDTENHAYSVNFSNIPDEWDKLYDARKMYLYDPIVRLMHENAGQTKLQWGYWEDAYQFGLDNPLGETDGEKINYREKITDLIKSAEKHQICSGLYFCWGDGYRQIILSMASPEKHYRPQEEGRVSIEKLVYSSVMLINQSIVNTNSQSCLTCNKNLRVGGGKTIKLTATEIKILNFFYGKKNTTIKHVARNCGTSVNTVNFHLRSLRKKLDAASASGHALSSSAKALNLI